MSEPEYEKYKQILPVGVHIQLFDYSEGFSFSAN